MNLKTELWSNHEIRFVEKDGEWWAVAKDISEALGYAQTSNMIKLIPKKYLISSILEGMNSKSILLSEFGIYKAIFNSHKKEASSFQEWVFNILKTLRQSVGLETFQIFRMLDKDHQKEAMSKLNQSLRKPVQVDFIKANAITNKAVSTMHGYSKMVKKEDMTPEMLVDRQPILEDTVNLMGLADKYGLDISVKQAIYNGLASKQTG
ncbi:MAG: Bro-N domain-containing protein [Anaerocolumna sp.]